MCEKERERRVFIPPHLISLTHIHTYTRHESAGKGESASKTSLLARAARSLSPATGALQPLNLKPEFEGVLCIHEYLWKVIADMYG